MWWMRENGLDGDVLVVRDGKSLVNPKDNVPCEPPKEICKVSERDVLDRQ